MPSIREEFMAARRRWATEGNLLAEGAVKDGLAEHRFGLKTDLGGLVNSVTGEVLPEGDGFKTGTKLVYGRAWELGFDRKAFDVVPRNAKALMIPLAGGVQWIGKGGDKTPGNVIYRKKAHIPAQKFAARPWLEPAIRSAYPELARLADEEFDVALKRAFPDRRITIG